MALSPLNTSSNSFPLSISPYQSRVSTHAEDLKNYTMIAFNPGYALQAAELNEIQELFFLNQNLTQRLNANWIRFNNGQITPFTAPYWEGLIPLTPDYVTFSGTASSFTLSISSGWYLYTDPTSKLSFWIWNDTDFSGGFSASETAYFGIDVTASYIGCCQTDDSCNNQDPTLRDGSQSFYQELTCGASRFKITPGSTLQSYNIAVPNTTFAQIMLVDLTSNTVRYPNNYTIAIL